MDDKEISVQVTEIYRYNLARKRLRDNLKKIGPKLICEATERMTLRELAKKAKLSPTYLSRVSREHVVLSKNAFLQLAKVIRETKKYKW